MGQPQGPCITSHSLWGRGKDHRARTQSAAKVSLPILPPEEDEILEAAKSHSDEASSQHGAKRDHPLRNMLEEPSAFVTCSSEMQRSLVQPRKNISTPGTNPENHLNAWE